MELDAASQDESLSSEVRERTLKKYWQQYVQWQDFMARLATAIVFVGGSEFWRSVDKALDAHWGAGQLQPVQDIVCLCLGSLDNQASVYQLSLVILVCERLGVCHEQCYFFDPCHTKEERGILSHLQFKMLRDSDQGKLQVRRMTLFYMPHGDWDLADNLIAANWCSLWKVAVLGNRFEWVCNGEACDGCCAVPVRAAATREVLPIVRATELPDTLFTTVRASFASLAPKISCMFGHRLVESMGCTLTTFPEASQWASIAWPQVPPVTAKL